MQRVELPGLPGELLMDGMTGRSRVTQVIYQDHRVTAWLLRLPAGQGVAIAANWVQYGWEFVLLPDWEAPNLESFVFALADFEWSVILADNRYELQQEVLEFMAEAGLESHEAQAFHYLQAERVAS